jgi:hypothetical protein
MAWARIHDSALSSPKVVGLFNPRDPFHLWIWGLSYCQLHLTDGAIPREAVPHGGDRAAVTLISKNLWAAAEGGYQVHDYLDWNDSREVVTKKRSAARSRMSVARDRSREQLQRTEREQIPRTSTEVLRGVVSLSLNNSDLTNQDLEKERERKPSELRSESRDPFTDPGITKRAGRFCERYQELYPAHRSGARYAMKPTRDYAAAVTLCTTWQDDARLEKLAICFLTTDHRFAAEGSRTIPQFLALASWCDGELAEWEKKQARA